MGRTGREVVVLRRHVGSDDVDRLRQPCRALHGLPDGLGDIADVFGRGVKIEVGDMLPSSAYAERMQRVPPIWDKAFEVNASEEPAVRAACMEFVLAGLYATDRISRSQRHGRIEYEF